MVAGIQWIWMQNCCEQIIEDGDRSILEGMNKILQTEYWAPYRN